MKKVIIFGSSGSIGKNALDVIRKSKNNFKVIGLCVYKDVETLFAQAKEFLPENVCIVDKTHFHKIKDLPKKIKVFMGKDGLNDFSKISSDISVMAIAGLSCLEPFLHHIPYTKRIALANKESIVTASRFVFKEAKKYNVEIFPIDSEINAIFQFFSLDKKILKNNLNKVYITASGGSLLNYRKKNLTSVKIKDVLSHPTWKMGKRITVDCATLVNKGFEVIEVHNFFGIPYEKIDVLIHRQSQVHALLELKDKTIIACLYPADMRIPISYALHYPERFYNNDGMDFKNKICFSFEPISFKKFPLLKLILEAAKREDNSLVILNACDEISIEYFLKKKIKFIHIYKALEYMFSIYPSTRLKTIEDVFYWDNWAREKTKEYLDRV
ncbi:MAG: 1-deoxy-D-xylulose-5-phosphate reductoisomerase [Candidatus Omnitrophica bacterium]|nr:1-deoxy-D-xylulose-5-phosphate reductoisomerase [Candidatus Omnitrophota bacterium]